MLNARKCISMFALLWPCFLNASVDDLNTSIDDATVLTPWRRPRSRIEVRKHPRLNKEGNLNRRVAQLEEQVNCFREVISVLYRNSPDTFRRELPEEVIEEIENCLNFQTKD